LKALILVGGEGTRLRPLTTTLPKPLLPVANVSFVERTLRRLAEVGCDEVVLSTCYKSEAFDHLAQRSEVRVRTVVESEPLGTGGAIGWAARGFDERFLVLNGDVLTDVDLEWVISSHAAFAGEATIVLTPVDDPSRFGVVPTDDGSRVIEFVEKPAPGTAPTNMINAGTYVVEPGMLERIPSGRAVSVEREVFPAMAAEGVLFGLASDAYWLDFGTHATYLQANLDCLSGALREPVPGRELSPGAAVRVDDGVEVAPDADIAGPAAIGAGTTVGAAASIGPDAVVGADVVIGEGAEVARSVLLDGAVIGAAARLDGVIVGGGGAVASGSVLGPGSVVPPGAGPVHVPRGGR